MSQAPSRVEPLFGRTAEKGSAVRMDRRIEELERENRELRRALRMVGALASAGLAVGDSEDAAGVVAESLVGVDGRSH